MIDALILNEGISPDLNSNVSSVLDAKNKATMKNRQQLDII
jgi:hypothetical protein